MPERRAPDRYADAVRARRSELHAQRRLLTGGHRTDLRHRLALARLCATADADAALAELARETRAHLDGADRPVLERLPALLSAAVGDLVAALHAEEASGLRPALRRIATERSLRMDPGWPQLAAPRLRPAPATPPAPIGTARSLLAGAADGAALWRLALFPLVVLPLLGLPAFGGPRLAPLAVGAGLAAVALAARSGRIGADRARLRRYADDVLANTRAELQVDLGRRHLELGRTAGAALDAAVTRRRAELEAELALLAADRPVQVRGG